MNAGDDCHQSCFQDAKGTIFQTPSSMFHAVQARAQPPQPWQRPHMPLRSRASAKITKVETGYPAVGGQSAARLAVTLTTDWPYPDASS